MLVTNRAFGGGFIETDFDGVFNSSTWSSITIDGLMFLVAGGTGRAAFCRPPAGSSEKIRRFTDFVFIVNPFFDAPVLYFVVASVTKASSLCLAESIRFK